MSLIRLYLGTKCEVCGSNWQWDMNTESLNVHFKRCSWLIWALNLNFKYIIRIPANCFLIAQKNYFHKDEWKQRVTIFTPTRNRGGVIFSLQFVCESVCLPVCVCVRLFLWTKLQPNGWSHLDAFFAIWLLVALSRTLLELVTLGQRSRSQWRNIHFSFIL